jgi:membrane protease subunit (stomatin/prohibitin family)
MGLFEKLRNELIDIIEWIDDDRSTLVWRFPRYQNEIKNGAQLIVRPGQVAVFVFEGKLADVFQPGRHQLATNNLPLLSTIMGWKYGFNSPFRCEVYFVRTTQVTDLKWGTPNPIMLRDAAFGPVRLRAFGTYALRCTNAGALIQQLVGTDGKFEAEEVGEVMRALISQSFAEVLGQSHVAALDLAANYRSMGETVRKQVLEKVDDEYGLDVPLLTIVNVSFPEEVEKALDTRSSMGVIGDMAKFQQFQMGHAIRDAATNPAGGVAGAGIGLGMGFGMMNQFAQGGMGMAQPGMAPPPPPPAAAFHVTMNGQTQGPYTAEQLAAGGITPETLVWSAGMAGWTPAGQVPALAAAFRRAAPPPPPPPPPAPAS